MQAIIITQPGEPEVLQLAERPIPDYTTQEVLIKVAAAGVNFPDILQRKGLYPSPKGVMEDIPGLEVAGTVEALGTAVTRWKVGDKVCALVNGDGYAEYCAVPAGQCLPIPNNLSFIEAASLPETYFTVWSNVFDRGGLKPGEALLVHGGSSGIGVAAIQMANKLGSDVYVTVGTEEKRAFCEALGAKKAINYKTESFVEEIKLATNGLGVIVILDMIGGDYTSGNLKTLATEGRLVMINAMNGRNAEVDLMMLMQKRLTLTGSTLRARDTDFKSQIAAELEKNIWPLLANGSIKPVINKVFESNEAAYAHRLMESSQHIGKIVITF
jgi:NADPH2:quinone reductase